MVSAPIDPIDDPRVNHKTTVLNGRNYHYYLAVPKEPYKATIFLIHGWPDLAYGWRFQIPALLEMGLRVVAPDMMGYGGTDAPQVPPEPISLYSHKRAADDIAALAKELNAPKIILGGHDWGGSIVYRVYLHHPTLVTHIFSVCTPYSPPSPTYHKLEDIVASILPNFAYQLQLAGPDVEQAVESKEDIRNFVNALFGGKGKEGEAAFNTKGVNLEVLKAGIGKSPLLSERDVEFYVEQYARNGLHGPLNWYRTRETNYNDELPLVEKPSIPLPVLFIQATNDAVLTPGLSAGMDQWIPHLTRKEVAAGHWALVQKPAEVNAHLKAWFEAVVFGGKPSL